MSKAVFQESSFAALDPKRLPSPCFVVDEAVLEHNLRILGTVRQKSGARILLALKAFSMFRVAPLVMRYLDGTCASGLWEARLGREEYGGEVHTFSSAYDDSELERILILSDHVVFNTEQQWSRFREQALAFRNRFQKPRLGLRINPEHSEAEIELYDPCAPASRLGVRHEQLTETDLNGISGFHFHTLCDQLYTPLERTLEVVERRFGNMLHGLEWLNLGGGHLITDVDYDVDALIQRVNRLQDHFGLQVYLEPGTAVALNAGVLVAKVLDVSHSGINQAILNCSAICHSPDILEAPYRPDVLGAGTEYEHAHTYQLGGTSCLAGDVFGSYSFDTPLEVGDYVTIEDQAYYTMVKTTTFNGLKLPAIALWNSQTDALEIVRQFDYEDFRHRVS